MFMEYDAPVFDLFAPHFAPAPPLDTFDDVPEWEYPSSAFSNKSSPAVETFHDVPEWDYPSSTLSNKSSFESFASSSSSDDAWDYHDFEHSLARSPAGFAQDWTGTACHVVEEEEEDDYGSDYGQWVVPDQLHLPYSKPPPPPSLLPSPYFDADAQRAILRKQASARSLARKSQASLTASFSSSSLSDPTSPASPILIGWTPPPAPPPPMLSSSPLAYFGLHPVSLPNHERSPFSPVAAHSSPSPFEDSYPCTPPQNYEMPTSPPPIPRRPTRKLPRSTGAKSSSKPSSAIAAASSALKALTQNVSSPKPKSKFKRSKPQFGSTFINFTMEDGLELLGGVAPSGNLKKPVGSTSRKSSPVSSPPSGGGKRKRGEEVDDEVDHRQGGGKRSK